MLIQKELTDAAARLGKTRLTVVMGETAAIEKRKQPVRKRSKKYNFLMPPVNEFNTAYLKEKKNDPL